MLCYVTNNIVFFFVILWFFLPICVGQTLPSMQVSSSLTSLYDLQQNDISGFVKSTNDEYRPIEEKEYIVDSGDEFVIKIDIPGPDIKTYYSKVTSDGYLIIPEATGWYVRGLKLSDVKDKIRKNLKKISPDARTEIYLEKIRPINVTVTGALRKVKDINLNSASRLYDLLNSILIYYQSDSLLTLKLSQASLRNISIIRNDNELKYDVLKYCLLSNVKENPYLQDNDIVHISYRDTAGCALTVSGSVGNPLKFEYKYGDDLQTALNFAGGITPAADSSRIEIYRYKGQSNDFSVITSHIPNDSSLQLKQDDRIFVRRKAEFHSEKYVHIKGEVKFPGIYPIDEGKTTLTEVIKRSGGFTENASLRHSRIYRDLRVPGSKELNKLIASMPYSMSLEWIEANFWRSAAKENLNIITCDFNKLFNENDMSQDVVLKHDDKIVISSQRYFVFITGSVINPGTIPYQKDWNYLDYIQASGGFKERARKTRIKIIKHNTETWLDAKDTIVIEPGDRIFIPQNEQKEPTTMFMQTLTIMTQIITIILVLRGIK